MAEGKQREEWGRWSAWMALFANANLPKDEPEVHPDRFNPFAERRPRPRLSKTESVKALSAIWGAKKDGRSK